MLRKPPHILVTTPESLFIFLTAERSRATLRSVRTVIVDEIHAMAGDKRGSHLALTLARLDQLVTSSGGAEAPTHRPLRDRQADRGGRRLPDRPRFPCDDRRRRPPPRDGTVRRRAERRTDARRDQRDVGRDLRPDRGADRGPPHDARLRRHAPALGARRVRARRNGSAKASSCRTTAASRAACVSSPSRASRRASCARSSRPPRSNSASTSVPSISSCRSARRDRSRSGCSASAAPATGSAPSPRACCSRRRATS